MSSVQASVDLKYDTGVVAAVNVLIDLNSDFLLKLSFMHLHFQFHIYIQIKYIYPFKSI